MEWTEKPSPVTSARRGKAQNPRTLGEVLIVKRRTAERPKSGKLESAPSLDVNLAEVKTPVGEKMSAQ